MNKLFHFWNISLVYGVGYLLVRALSFLLLPLYTNLLSVNDAGIVFIFYTVLAFLNTLYNHGMDSALLKFFNSHNHKSVITTSLIYSFFLGCIFSLLLILVYHLVGFSHVFGGTELTPLLIYYLCAILLFDMLSSRTMNVLRLTERPYYYFTVSFVSVFVSFFCNYYYISVLDYGVNGVFFSLLIASFIQVVLLVPIITINFQLSYFSLPVLKKMFFFALPFFPASIFFVLIEISDRWMLGWLGSIEDIGLYGAGYKVGSLILMVVLAFNLNWQPFYLKKNQPNQSLESVGNLFVIMLIFITTCLSCLWPTLIKINMLNFYVIGESFWIGGSIVPIIAISYFFYGVFILQMPAIYIKNKQNWIPFIWGFGLLINLTSNYFLIQKFGFVGAAYSTLFTYLSMSIFIIFKGRTWLPLLYDYPKILKVIFVGSVIYIISLYFNDLYITSISLLIYSFLIFSTLKSSLKASYE